MSEKAGNDKALTASNKTSAAPDEEQPESSSTTTDEGNENKSRATLPVVAPPTASQLAELREKAELYDRYVSQYKEVQRSRNEAALAIEALQKSFSDLLTKVINVEDDLERAVEHALIGRNFEAVAAGLRPIIHNLDALLASEGVSPIAALGQGFDPQRHQCLDPVPTTDSSRLVVSKELRRGYLFDGKVLRKAIVEVDLLD